MADGVVDPLCSLNDKKVNSSELSGGANTQACQVKFKLDNSSDEVPQSSSVSVTSSVLNRLSNGFGGSCQPVPEADETTDDAMSVRVSGVYLVPTSPSVTPTGGGTPPPLLVAPQRSNSLDYLNFEEKRQIIASSLSLSDFLHHGPAVAAAKGVEATKVIVAAKKNGTALRTNSLGSTIRTPPLERKSKFSALGRLFKPWKWKRKKKSEKFEAASRSLERKISVRANRDELVQKGILLPENPSLPLSPSGAEPSELPSPNGSLSMSTQGPSPPYTCSTFNNQEPKKDKTDEGSGGPDPGGTRPERPSSLGGPGKLTRRLLCYHNDLCVSHNSPTRAQTQPSPSEDDAPLDPNVKTPFQSLTGKGTPPPDRRQPASTTLTLSELPEPPIPVSEIGPIPPPPMFSSPSPTLLLRQGVGIHNAVPLDLSDFIYVGDDNDDEQDNWRELRFPEPDPNIDTSLVEEIPAKEPKFHAMPLKSALKKKGSSGGSGGGTPQDTPTQEGRALQPRQEHMASLNRPVRFGIALPCAENKENTRPHAIQEDADSDSGDGPVLYRDDDDDENRLAAKIARKDSLALKLALRPDRQELIDRNILQVQSEKERLESKEAVGARLIRRLSMRPTPEELVDRNILKTQSAEAERKSKEEKKKMLLRKLSFRPTVEELKEKKIIRFNDYIEVTQAHEYDRRADKPWTRLTPKDKAAIRKELNEFKSSEMAVHDDSRHLTRFHRP